MREVKLNLGRNSYGISIGFGLLMQAAQRLKECGFIGKLVIITNPVVKRLYGTALKRNLAREGFKVSLLSVPDGEEQKSLEVAGKLYNELTKLYAERTTPILALGGGVIGDLAGFVAATYARGVPLIQMPTTLLAQVDSSIGGKVAVNHGQLKNKIGAFYQPSLVISDISTLKTLPTSEFISGLAEVIKYGVIGNKTFFNYLERNIGRIQSLDEDVLEEVVYRSARIKARIVERDEKDQGLRNILNYGHTIGHALESVSNLNLEHGKAVAIGMLAAARISNQLGMLAKSEITRLKSLVEKAGLPTELPGLQIPSIIQAIKHDKKISRGKIKFILPTALGDVFITDEVNLALVERVLVNWNGEA